MVICSRDLRSWRGISSVPPRKNYSICAIWTEFQLMIAISWNNNIKFRQHLKLNGLQIVPPEAHFTGPIFGERICFSDSVSKSAAYCRLTNGTGLVLLCVVAVDLSDIRYHHDSSKLITYCQSVQATGQNYPNQLHVWSDDLKILNGKLIRRTEINSHRFYWICCVWRIPRDD